MRDVYSHTLDRAHDLTNARHSLLLELPRASLERRLEISIEVNRINRQLREITSDNILARAFDLRRIA